FPRQGKNINSLRNTQKIIFPVGDKDFKEKGKRKKEKGERRKEKGERGKKGKRQGEMEKI
ncbi:MAG TPA: hypothetical protein PK910_06840, partial [Bacteroidales bacterium]|nr:hypothetical protein [Bacteroidales bacterium]